MEHELDEYDQRARAVWLTALPHILDAIRDSGLPGPLNVSRAIHEPDVVTASYGTFSQTEFARTASALANVYGRPETTIGEGALKARWTVGDSAELHYTLWSDICTQVVVGTERKVVREEVTPAEYAEVEKDVDIVEWRCPEGLFDDLLLTKGNLR